VAELMESFKMTINLGFSNKGNFLEQLNTRKITEEDI